MHAYPIGFLYISKMSQKYFGDNEIAWRLFPFISSILGLCIFVVLARKILSPLWALVAALLFAVSPMLVYMSSSLRPYSSDVMVSAFLVWLLYRMKQKDIVLD